MLRTYYVKKLARAPEWRTKFMPTGVGAEREQIRDFSGTIAVKRLR